MRNFYFERECRTSYSECYTIIEEDEPMGRVDLHYTSTVVHATLCVSESQTQDAIQELIDAIDDDIVNAVGVSREEFIVHVHQGREVGVFNNPEFGHNGGSE